MKKIIKTTHPINASSDTVWEHIKKGKGLDKWLPVITACTLEGEGEGAKRTCELEQGKMLETILKIDEKEKIFQYSIDEQPLLPITHIKGTMQVLTKGEETELGWNLEFFLPDEQMFPMVKQTIKGLYSAGAKGLENLSNS